MSVNQTPQTPVPVSLAAVLLLAAVLVAGSSQTHLTTVSVAVTVAPTICTVVNIHRYVSATPVRVYVPVFPCDTPVVVMVMVCTSMGVRAGGSMGICLFLFLSARSEKEASSVAAGPISTREVGPRGLGVGVGVAGVGVCVQKEGDVDVGFGLVEVVEALAQSVRRL